MSVVDKYGVRVDPDDRPQGRFDWTPDILKKFWKLTLYRLHKAGASYRDLGVAFDMPHTTIQSMLGTLTDEEKERADRLNLAI